MSVHAARSIIPYRPHSVKQKMQKSFFFLFGITVLILIFIFAFGIKDLYKFPAGDYRKCVRGMLLILIGFGILWKITALVNIPREYLPPECILDLGFYLH